MSTPLAAAYIRVSTSEQEKHGFSLASQEKKVLAHIEAEGWALDKLYIEAMSGTKDARPRLAELLTTLDRIDYVVIITIDRFGRDDTYLFNLYGQFKRANVTLIATDENIDDSENGLLLRGIQSTLAAHESRRIGKRVKAGIAESASQGNHHSQWPFGYEDGKPGPGAAVVLRIFQESADGESQRRIAGRLNAEGIVSARGKTWGQPQVRAVLDNVTYTGRVRDKDGTIYDGKHEAIVSIELWDKVQTLRKANRRDSGGQARGRRPKGKHLFTRGLLRCAHCGAAMTPWTATSGHESYVCSRRRQSGASACVQRNVPRAELDSAVFAFFESERFDPQATKQQIEAKVSATHTQRTELLTTAQRAEAKAAEALKRVRGDYTAGEITAAEWRNDFRPELEEALEAAQAKRELLEQQASASAAEVEAIAKLADSAAIQGLASVRAEIAGKVAGSVGIESVRASLGLLFERFEIARAPLDGSLSAVEQQIVEAQDREYGEDDTAPLLAVGEWTVAMYPRTEWIGDLDGYWREILDRVPLVIFEQSTTLARY